MGADIAFMSVWVILTIGSIAAIVLVILAIWRAMKAHESIAGSMKEIAAALQSQAKAGKDN